MHRVIKKALVTFERESKLPPDEKRGAWSWLEAFGRVCSRQAGDEITSLLEVMPKDRLLATIASWVKWKFNRRGSLHPAKFGSGKYYRYSLGIDSHNCPSCVCLTPKLKTGGRRSTRCAIFVGGCEGCPVRMIHHTCTVTGSPYKEACYAGRKASLVNALWEAVEWAIEHEGEEKENGPT